MKYAGRPGDHQGCCVLVSDGLAGQWDLSQDPGLPSRATRAHRRLHRDFARGRDEFTLVMVVRELSGWAVRCQASPSSTSKAW